MTFKLGITRDVLDAAGKPNFGVKALDVLNAAPELEWEYIPESMTEITPEIAARYDALYVTSPRVTRATMSRADCRVKIVARHGVGYDTVDVPALTARGIVLTTTPAALRRPVAVAALTLIFALTGRLPIKDRLVRENRWRERNDHMGVGLASRTLGVIGAGGIGQELLTLARPFFARRLAADPHVDPARLAALGAEPAPLDTLMSDADIVVICCLLTDETRHLVDDRQLRRMKPTAFLVNVARGPVVDEPALIAALREKRIAGAGLDVFEQEPIDPGHPLIALDNVILTPHALCWTDECFHQIASTGLQSVVDFSLGKRPVHIVNPEAFRAPS